MGLPGSSHRLQRAAASAAARSGRSAPARIRRRRSGRSIRASTRASSRIATRLGRATGTPPWTRCSPSSAAGPREPPMKSCEIWVAFNRLVMRISAGRNDAFDRIEILDSVSDNVLMTYPQGEGRASATRFRTHSGASIDYTFVSNLVFDRGLLSRLLQDHVRIRVTRDQD